MSPLPPYITRDTTEEDKERYQTVYATERGSVAAPTAGLHFSDKLIKKIEKKGFKARIKIESGISELVNVFNNSKENIINNYSKGV